MAIPVEPATSAIFRALRSVGVDPDLAYEAAEESRRQAGENVIAVIGAQIAELRVENGEIRTEMKAGFTEVNARIEAQTSRIDVLQRVILICRSLFCWPRLSLACSTKLSPARQGSGSDC